jgi:hypothetical protein
MHRALKDYRLAHNVSNEDHAHMLGQLEWNSSEFETGHKKRDGLLKLPFGTKKHSLAGRATAKAHVNGDSPEPR